MDTDEVEPTGAARRTVVGLFEDQIDAEQAILALRKADHVADHVSIVVRDKAADGGRGADRTGAVARALVDTSLDSVGDWLHGLAALVVPERGTFLVAGPIGAALAGIGAGEGGTGEDAATPGAGGLLRTLAEFGFAADEATYLEHRLVVGVSLIAVTTDDRGVGQATRRLFADQNAVHIGMASTDARFLEQAEALLHAPPERSSGGDVVVTDAVAPLRRLAVDGGSTVAAALLHRSVVDDTGEAIGKVEEVLEEGDARAGDPATVRYLVVGFGGLLGLRHHRAAVPVERADLEADPIRLRLAKPVLQRAPAFDEHAPFSRREEFALYAYYGLNPYWPDA